MKTCDYRGCHWHAAAEIVACVGQDDLVCRSGCATHCLKIADELRALQPADHKGGSVWLEWFGSSTDNQSSNASGFSDPTSRDWTFLVGPEPAPGG